jgi:anti-sigma B factor antagonist
MIGVIGSIRGRRLNQPEDGFVRPMRCQGVAGDSDERGKTVNTNVRGMSVPRRRRAGREDVGAGARVAHGGVRHSRAAGRAMTTTIVRRHGASVVVRIGGEIDVHTAGELRTVLLALVDGGHTHIVADLAGVGFCDAAGLGALVAVNNRAREHGGALRLTGVRPAQRRILRITRLDQLFRLYDSVDDALTS